MRKKKKKINEKRAKKEKINKSTYQVQYINTQESKWPAMACYTKTDNERPALHSPWYDCHEAPGTALAGRAASAISAA